MAAGPGYRRDLDLVLVGDGVPVVDRHRVVGRRGRDRHPRARGHPPRPPRPRLGRPRGDRPGHATARPRRLGSHGVHAARLRRRDRDLPRRRAAPGRAPRSRWSVSPPRRPRRPATCRRSRTSTTRRVDGRSCGSAQRAPPAVAGHRVDEDVGDQQDEPSLGLAQHPRGEHLGAHARHPQPAVAVAAQHRPVRGAGARAGDVQVGERRTVGARVGPRAARVPARGARGRRTARPRRASTAAGPGSDPRRRQRHDRDTAHQAQHRRHDDERMRGPMGPACADPAARVGRHPQVPWTRDVGLPDRGPRPRRRRLPRGLGAAATGARPGRGRRPAAHRPAARAPAGVHRRQAHRRPTSGPRIPAARRSSTSTAAARSPSTARASWSATRSCALPDHVKVVDYVRRVEEALIGVCRDLGVDHRTGSRTQRRVAPGRTTAARSARSPRSASASAAA